MQITIGKVEGKSMNKTFQLVCRMGKWIVPPIPPCTMSLSNGFTNHCKGRGPMELDCDGDTCYSM